MNKPVHDLHNEIKTKVLLKQINRHVTEIAHKIVRNEISVSILAYQILH
jgi:hypothetical protein